MCNRALVLLKTVAHRLITLLLTATIDPGATLSVTRRDPQIRLNDYVSALEAWLSCAVTRRVVFCENSGFDLSPLGDLAARYRDRTVELISFHGNDAGPLRGKGYSEFRLIEHAMHASTLLGGSDIVFKCTGRLTARNAVPLLKAIAASDFAAGTAALSGRQPGLCGHTRLHPRAPADQD